MAFTQNFGGNTSNTLSKETSYTFPAATGFRVKAATETDNKPIEILNMGIVSESVRGDAFNQTNLFLARVNWSFELGLNVKWDNTNKKWVYDHAAHPSCMIELGKEGVTFHAVPAGQNLSDTWHELLQIRADGADGASLGTTYRQLIQHKTTNYFRFQSGAYNNNDAHAWTGGDGAKPGIWFHTEEPKSGEWIRIEQNSASATPPPIAFYKSAGSFGSKSAAPVNHNTININGQLWDGANYQMSARIITFSTAAAAANNAPQKLAFQVGNSLSAGTNPLSSRFEIFSEGYFFAKTVFAAPTGNPTTGVFWWFDASGNMLIKLPNGETRTVTATTIT